MTYDHWKTTDPADKYFVGERFECSKCGFVIAMENDSEWQCIHCGTWNNVDVYESDPDDARDAMMDRMLDQRWDSD